MSPVVSLQVLEFLQNLPPEPRRALRLGIKRLPKHLGDIRPLEGKLRDYYRLRVGSYRVIFKRRMEKGNSLVECLYVNRRSIVYEVFEKLAGHPEV